MLYTAPAGSENGLQSIGDTLKTRGGSASSSSHGISLALSASAIALISSKMGCAPRSVKNNPIGEPKNIIRSGVKGIVVNIFFGRHGPHVPCLRTFSAPRA